MEFSHLHPNAVKNIKAYLNQLHETNNVIEMTGTGSKHKYKLLELFKGTGSVGKVAHRMNMDVQSLDVESKYEPNVLVDILEWDYKKWVRDNNFVPDFIWASPPCNTYSPLVYPLKERDPKTAEPFSDRAKVGTQILYKTLQIIKYFQKINPKLLFVIENPRGMMRNDKQIKKLDLNNTLYCLYNDFKRKSTDFFTNVPNGLKLKQGTKCPDPDKIIEVSKLDSIEKRYSIPYALIKQILSRMIEEY